MWQLRNLIDHCNSTHICINGEWMPARPLLDPWITRLKDAWKVYTGEYDALKWPGNQ